MGGMVSTGLAAVLGTLAVVQGCDAGRAVLLGAGGRAPGGGSSTLLRSSPEGATEADVGRGPEVMSSVRRGDSRWRGRWSEQGQAFLVSLGQWVRPYPGKGRGSG